MKAFRVALGLSAAVLVSAGGRHEGTAETLSAAVRAFIGSLDAQARRELRFAFDSDARHDWHYVPRFRDGVAFGDLDDTQRSRLDGVLAAGLSESGAARARGIVELEAVLREAERRSWRWPVHFLRSPGHYHVSVFGDPGRSGDAAGPDGSDGSGSGPWGLRIEGHHLSLNYTLVGREIATGPLFMGANPHEVSAGPRAGWRVLGEEEDAARALLAVLDAERLARARVSPEAPDDIVTGPARAVAPLAPLGVARAELDAPQRAALDALLAVYLGRFPDDVAAARRAAIEAAGAGAIRFAWMGSLEPGEPHYYRVQGPTFLIEYDNVQNDANHSHTVWRELDGDFGRDLLAEHYRRSHARVVGPRRARARGG